MTNNEKMNNLKHVFGNDVCVRNAKTYKETLKNVRDVVSTIVSNYVYEIAYREGKINSLSSCRISALFGNLDNNNTSGLRRVHAIVFGLIDLASEGVFAETLAFEHFKRDLDMMITPVVKENLGI